MARPAPAPTRRTLVVLCLLIAAGFAGGVTTAAIRGDDERGRPIAEPRVRDYFDDQTLERSRAYTRPRYAVGFASLGLGLAVMAALALTPAGRAVGAWAERVAGGRWPATAAILAAAVTLVPAIATLGLDAWRGYFHERAYGLSTQSAWGWLADVAKANLFQAVIVAIAAIGFFFLVHRFPRGWPVAAGGFLVTLTVVLVVVYPLVYEPLFNRFTPVDAATRDRIVALANRAGVRVDRVLVADASRRTTRQNAYVSGLGATKRVVLYDTLLSKSSVQETDLVVAHELGHVVHRDVWRGTLLACAGAAGAAAMAWLLLGRPAVVRLAGASGAGDPRALPLLAFAFAAATLVTLPVANGFSRSIEASADRFAIRLTENPDTAVRVEVNLATDNIADLQPNRFVVWMFFTHPPVMERIGIALEEGAG